MEEKLFITGRTVEYRVYFVCSCVISHGYAIVVGFVLDWPGFILIGCIITRCNCWKISEYDFLTGCTCWNSDGYASTTGTLGGFSWSCVLLCLAFVPQWFGAAVVIQAVSPSEGLPRGWPCWIFLIVFLFILCGSLQVSLAGLTMMDCVGNILNTELHGWMHWWRKYLACWIYWEITPLYQISFMLLF